MPKRPAASARAARAISAPRRASVTRTTKETDIAVTWDLDAAGPATIRTGIGFFDHMLEALAKHSGTTLSVRCRGDLHIDGHHTSEDVGIVMGQALRQALGARIGIERFGHIACPLDEALCTATIDISGRPYLVYNVPLPKVKIGDFDVELVREFFQGFVNHCGANLHINLMYGDNVHHILEACFKAAARALDQATQMDPRIEGVMSTQGKL